VRFALKERTLNFRKKHPEAGVKIAIGLLQLSLVADSGDTLVKRMF
jgi:hypothetical protein